MRKRRPIRTGERVQVRFTQDYLGEMLDLSCVAANIYRKLQTGEPVEDLELEALCFLHQGLEYTFRVIAGHSVEGVAEVLGETENYRSN